jgi:hypothetical protein
MIFSIQLNGATKFVPPLALIESTYCVISYNDQAFITFAVESNGIRLRA